MAIRFDTEFDPQYGRAVILAPDITRVTARNPGPFTFLGTNSFVVGDRDVAVIDPGPKDGEHRQALLTAIAGRAVRAILVTHTHRDHSPGAAALAAETGAPILGARAHELPVSPPGEMDQRLEASVDRDYRPDRILGDTDRVAGEGWALETVATPGHTANHLAFALAGEDALFCGDCVMGWSTTVIAPPDGSMGAYMATLRTLMGRSEKRYFPAHGGQIESASDHVRALLEHRREREAAILALVAKGVNNVPAIVAAVYRDLDDRLVGAATLSTLAHLEHLVEKEAIVARGPIQTGTHFEMAKKR